MKLDFKDKNSSIKLYIYFCTNLIKGVTNVTFVRTLQGIAKKSKVAYLHTKI